MQRDLYGFLRQKARLAALGAAVARIQHDLRNILANAQLTSDRLAASEDPVVKRLAPVLVASIDRAIALATNTLKYGRVEEPAPQRAAVPLRALLDEVAQSILGDGTRITFDNRVAADFEIDADRDQLFRMTLNLIRNAADALAVHDARGQIMVSVTNTDRSAEIEIADNGPGIPQSVLGRLFEPFASAARAGGTGLGLAIARDLARAHGGDICLVSTGPGGTVFRIIIPDRS
jgi:signal transduction histidine kinase